MSGGDRRARWERRVRDSLAVRMWEIAGRLRPRTWAGLGAIWAGGLAWRSLFAAWWSMPLSEAYLATAWIVWSEVGEHEQSSAWTRTMAWGCLVLGVAGMALMTPVLKVVGYEGESREMGLAAEVGLGLAAGVPLYVLLAAWGRMMFNGEGDVLDMCGDAVEWIRYRWMWLEGGVVVGAAIAADRLARDAVEGWGAAARWWEPSGGEVWTGLVMGLATVATWWRPRWREPGRAKEGKVGRMAPARGAA